MSQLTRATRLRLFIIVLAFAGLGFLLWLRTRGPGFNNDYLDFNANRTREFIESSPAPTSTPTPSLEPTPSATSSPGSSSLSPPDPPQDKVGPTNNNTSSAPPESFVGQLNLVIPVAGVRADQLRDTFAEARGEGRVHDAIDIIAPAGTPVIAVSDGQITKLFQSERGGTTIYQLSPDKKLVFYYAHLQRYADGINEGKYVKQGEVIGYVGDTGNAGAGNYHLHFSIAALADPKRYWDGTNINPYPLLKK